MTALADPTVVPTSILRQGTYWLTWRDGELRTVHIDQMGHDHRANLLRWLRAHAEQLRATEDRNLARHLRHQLISPHQHALAIAALRLDQPAAVWLHDTTLVRRLVQLVPTEPRPPRRRRLLPARLMRRWGR